MATSTLTTFMESQEYIDWKFRRNIYFMWSSGRQSFGDHTHMSTPRLAATGKDDNGILVVQGKKRCDFILDDGFRHSKIYFEISE